MLLTNQDRCYGCFFGSVVGDALGGPVEFKVRDKFEKVVDMNLYNFNLGLEPGSWTDDTSMMLCLSKSLIDYPEYNAKDTLIRYSKWFRNGYMSSTSNCIDIGKTTATSIRDFELNGMLISSLDKDQYSGNGSIMRLTPIPILYSNKSINYCIEQAGKSSLSTHSSKLCIESCKLLGFIIHNLINGVTKKDLIIKLKEFNTITELQSICNSDFLNKSIKDIESSGYVISTLESALYSFYKFDTFKESVLFAVNLGNDSDTVGCVTGIISGAYYGIRKIPIEWIKTLKKQNLLWGTIDALMEVKYHENDK